MTVIALVGLLPALVAAAPGSLALSLSLAPGTPGMMGSLVAMAAPLF